MSFTIKSNSSDLRIEFLPCDQLSFSVNVFSARLQFTTIINIYVEDLNSSILDFFIRVANHKIPWKNEISWVSLYRDFSISATCSSLGDVLFSIKISDSSEEYSGQNIEISFNIDKGLGEIESIAQEAQEAFKK